MPQLSEQVSHRLPAELIELIQSAPLPPLNDGTLVPDLCDWLMDHPSLGVDSAPVDQAAFRCCGAGLWLIAGDLERSHAISQEVKTADGSFWHGIMHRREGDYWNAKYWFRSVGRHPVFPQLAAESKTHWQGLSLRNGDTWDPMQFVDLCEQAAKKSGPTRDACLHLSWYELQQLLAYCWNRAWPTDPGVTS